MTSLDDSLSLQPQGNNVLQVIALIGHFHLNQNTHYQVLGFNVLNVVYVCVRLWRRRGAEQ